jgi:hypothetical protein
MGLSEFADKPMLSVELLSALWVRLAPVTRLLRVVEWMLPLKLAAVPGAIVAEGPEDEIR